MSDRLVIVRETVIRMIINTLISIGFFYLVFSFGLPVQTAALAPDFPPQAFMVALMGSMVPALLLGHRIKKRASGIVRRSFIIATAALILAGGGAFALSVAAATIVSSPTALMLKAAFGALLALIVTPFAPPSRYQIGSRSCPAPSSIFRSRWKMTS